MACEKAGTGFLGYPVTLLFITRYSITASFVKTKRFLEIKPIFEGSYLENSWSNY